MKPSVSLYVYMYTYFIAGLESFSGRVEVRKIELFWPSGIRGMFSTGLWPSEWGIRSGYGWMVGWM